MLAGVGASPPGGQRLAHVVLPAERPSPHFHSCLRSMDCRLAALSLQSQFQCARIVISRHASVTEATSFWAGCHLLDYSVDVHARQPSWTNDYLDLLPAARFVFVLITPVDVDPLWHIFGISSMNTVPWCPTTTMIDTFAILFWPSETSIRVSDNSVFPTIPCSLKQSSSLLK